MRTAKQEAALQTKINNLIKKHIPGYTFMVYEPEDYIADYGGATTRREYNKLVKEHSSWMGITNNQQHHIVLNDFLYYNGTPKEIINVVIHEIAHADAMVQAEAYQGEAHGELWRKKCIKLGGDGCEFMKIEGDVDKWTFTGTNEAA